MWTVETRSSACWADQMESLKDRKVGPSGVRTAQRDRQTQGIGSQRLSRSATEPQNHRTTAGEPSMVRCEFSSCYWGCKWSKRNTAGKTSY